MKTIIYVLPFLLLNASLQLHSQSLLLSSVNANEQKLSCIKAFESKYLDGKVYLHVTVNNNTETRTLEVERSVDATHFEVVGYIKLYGSPTTNDLAYYFTDESPVISNLYYRLTYNVGSDEPVYSETINVVPVSKKIAEPSGYIVTPLYCYKE
jgi:hypothetical protein